MEFPSTSASVETLPNGLTLILDPDATAPVVSAQIWVETGSVHEDRHLGAGISHFLEHMVFKGTRDHDADTLANTVQAAGGHWNAYTTFDRTVYYIDGPSKSLSPFLHCLTGLVFFPTLPESEFEREKDVIRREIDMGHDDPDQSAMRLMLSTCFQRDPRRHPVIGHRHRFDHVAYEDLRSYHQQRYTTDRCILVLSGDFDPADARQQVAELTADCLPGCGREPVVAHDDPQLGARQARDTFAIPTSRLSMVWKTPPLHHPDTPAYDALANILGRGRSARLYQSLRESRQLALEISAFCWTSPGREGLFGISADCHPDQREALIDAIHEELAQLHTGSLVSDLDKAKRQLAASQFRGLSTASGRATDLALNWHEARDLDFTRHYLEAVDALQPEDLLRAAGILNRRGLTLTILDPLDAPPPPRKSKTRSRRAEFRVETLPNGLQLAMIPDHRVPMLHFQAAIRAGLPAESPETQGINQLLASSLPKGTLKRSATRIALDLESLGASISASAGNNALLLQAAGLAPDLAVISSVFAEVLTQPALEEGTVERERASQVAALEEAMQHPLHVGLQALRESCFGPQGYGLDALGNRESLARIDREALVQHHGRHVGAANLTLAVAGDFEPEALRDLLAEQLDELPSGTRWEMPPSRFHDGRELVRHLPKKQAVLVLGYAGASATHEERHALAFLQEYASDMAGPLFLRIREQLGLAYQVGAHQFLGHDTGLFSFYLATSPEQLDQARGELLAEIRKIGELGIPDDAFERVRSTVLSGVAIQQQSISSKARHSALDMLFGHPADEHERLAQTYEAVTAAQVRQVARQMLDATPHIVTVLPED